MPSRGYPDRKINPAFLVSVEESRNNEQQEHSGENRKESFNSHKSDANSKNEPIVITSSDSSSLTTSALPSTTATTATSSSSSSSTTVQMHKVQEPHYIAMPSSLRKLQHRFPSLEHTLVMECTRCKRWVATEVLHHISNELTQTTMTSFVDESTLASLPPLSKQVKKEKEKLEFESNAHIKNKRHRYRYSDDLESNSVSLVNSMNLEWHSPRLRAIAERHTKDNKSITVNDAEIKEEKLNSEEHNKYESHEEQLLEILESKATNFKWEEELLEQIKKEKKEEECSSLRDNNNGSNSLRANKESNVVPSTRPEMQKEQLQKPSSELYIPNPKTFCCTWYDCEKSDVFMDLRREWLGKLYTITINDSMNSNDHDDLKDGSNSSSCISFIEQLENVLTKRTLLNDQLAHELQIRRSDRIVHQSHPTENNNHFNSTHKESVCKNSKTSSSLSPSLPLIHGPMDDFLRRCNAPMSKTKMQHESEAKHQINKVNVESNSLISTSMRVDQLQEILNRVHLLQVNIPLLPISENAHKHDPTKHNGSHVNFSQKGNMFHALTYNSSNDNKTTMTTITPRHHNGIIGLNNTDLNALLHNEEILLSSFCYVVCERCGKVRRVAQPFPGGSPFVCELVYPYNSNNCKLSEVEFMIMYTKHYLFQELLNCVDHEVSNNIHDKAEVAPLEVEGLHKLPKEEHLQEEEKQKFTNNKDNIDSHVQSYEVSNSHLERYCNVVSELENDPLIQMIIKIIESKCNSVFSMTKSDNSQYESSIHKKISTSVEDKENVLLKDNTSRNKNGKRVRTENNEHNSSNNKFKSTAECRLNLFPTIKALSLQLRRRSILPSSKYLWLSPREIQQKRESTLHKLYLDETHNSEIANRETETGANTHDEEKTETSNRKLESSVELIHNKNSEKLQGATHTTVDSNINKKNKFDIITSNTKPTVRRRRGRRTRVTNKALELESRVEEPQVVLESKHVEHYSVSDDTQNTTTSEAVEVLAKKKTKPNEEIVNYDTDVDEDDKCIVDLLDNSNLHERLSNPLTHSILTITESLSSSTATASSSTLPAEPQILMKLKLEQGSKILEKTKGKRSYRRHTLTSVSDMNHKINKRGRKKLKHDDDVHKVFNSNEILGVDNSIDDAKEEEILHWVLCDRCNKWRIVPRPLPTNLEFWECNMRDDHTTCDDTDDETRVARGTMVYP